MKVGFCVRDFAVTLAGSGEKRGRNAAYTVEKVGFCVQKRPLALGQRFCMVIVNAFCRRAIHRIGGWGAEYILIIKLIQTIDLDHIKMP
jgi:hypothetical protein